MTRHKAICAAICCGLALTGREALWQENGMAAKRQTDNWPSGEGILIAETSIVRNVRLGISVWSLILRKLLMKVVRKSSRPMREPVSSRGFGYPGILQPFLSLILWQKRPLGKKGIGSIQNMVGSSRKKTCTFLTYNSSMR
jgi:hypothetical protein